MTDSSAELPPNLVEAADRDGRTAWLSTVPATVVRLASAWSLSVEAPFQPGGRTVVAATNRWADPDDGIRYPAAEVHAWERGHNETVCGLSLSTSRLGRSPHVRWEDVQPEAGRHAEAVQAVCRRCRAALGARRDERGWTRTNPRP